MEENINQRALRKWLAAGLKIPEVTNLHGDAGYLLSNMIAKYSLAANFYTISEEALVEFQKQGVDLSKTHTRRSFYGKKDGMNPFIYEHIVPARVIREELRSCSHSNEDVQGILGLTGGVAVILRTEDLKLKKSGLGCKMPEGWRLGGDPKVRYKTVGIDLSTEVLRVKGAICR